MLATNEGTLATNKGTKSRRNGRYAPVSEATVIAKARDPADLPGLTNTLAGSCNDSGVAGRSVWWP